MDRPKLLPAAVAFVGLAVGTLLGAAHEYPFGLALGCGALAVGWVVILNLPLDAPYLLRLLLMVPVAVGLAVIAGTASSDDLSVAAPFLVLLVTLAVHLATLAALRWRRPGNPAA